MQLILNKVFCYDIHFLVVTALDTMVNNQLVNILVYHIQQTFYKDLIYFSLQVYISSKGIKIVAPSLKNESREVALQIQLKEVVRILVHFGKGLPVIFLYTMSKCGGYIRKVLDMSEESGN